MKEIHIPVSFQGRYYADGGIDEQSDCPEFWFVLHGQGQLAGYFIRKFNSIINPTRKFIAPEGLSRYYIDGFKGRVGSTWMTKEDRSTDIANYLEFLTQIYKKEIPQPDNCKITLLGFSQGAATASRWALTEGVRFDRLILWSGLFPPDLDFELGSQKMKGIEVLNIYGEQDEFLNEARIKEQFQLAEQLGIELTTKSFHGGHEIDQDTLLALI